MKSPTEKTASESLLGTALAVPAFLIWGLSPIYYKAVHFVPAFEILMHRMVWSFLFLLPILVALRRFDQFIAALRNRRIMAALALTTIIVGGNWFVFIWAINTGRILQTSLGYYINPLVNVLLGTIILKEKLRPAQTAAVVLAGIGVTYLTLMGGEFPWISLALAFSFAFYALVRKTTPVGPLVGLSVEMLYMSPFALTYLVYIGVNHSGIMLTRGYAVDLLLMSSALVTALPLLLFNGAAKRLNLSSVGFLQYIAPSCSFLLAVFVYDEPFSSARLWSFIAIWTALALYSFDSARHFKRKAA